MDKLAKKSDKLSIGVLDWTFLVGLYVGSVIVRLYFLFRSSLAYGIDGAYYLIKTEEVLRNFIPSDFTPPLYFWLSALFSKFFSVSQAVKIVGAVFAPLAIIGTFFLARYLFKRKDIAYMTAVLVAVSSSYLRLLDDLLKNALAMVFVPLFLLFVLKSFENKKFIFLVVLWGILAGLSHVPTSMILLLTLALWGTYEIGYQLNIKNRITWTILIICSIFLILALPFWSQLADFSSYMNFSRSDLFPTNFSEFLSEYGLLVLFAFSGFITLFVKKDVKYKNLILVWMLLSVVVSQPFLVKNSMRFVWLAFYPVSFLTAYIFIAFDKYVPSLITRILFGALILFLCIPFAQQGLKMRPIIEPYEVGEIKEFKQDVPKDATIYGIHNGYEYWFTYLTGIEVEGVTPETLKDKEFEKNSYFLVVEEGRRGIPLSMRVSENRAFSKHGRFALYKTEDIEAGEFKRPRRREPIKERPFGPQSKDTSSRFVFAQRNEGLGRIGSPRPPGPGDRALPTPGAPGDGPSPPGKRHGQNQVLELVFRIPLFLVFFPVVIMKITLPNLVGFFLGIFLTFLMWGFIVGGTRYFWGYFFSQS